MHQQKALAAFGYHAATRFLQDKSINVLRYLHRECMNGRHEGREHVLALMRLRGVEPDFRALARKYRSRRARRRAKRACGKASNAQT